MLRSNRKVAGLAQNLPAARPDRVKKPTASRLLLQHPVKVLIPFVCGHVARPIAKKSRVCSGGLHFFSVRFGQRGQGNIV
jgi:hypothetical protein